MISGYVMYVLLFCSLYFEIFLLTTYIEKRKVIKNEYLKIKNENWPTTTIIVPCWNESKTVVNTVNSILNLDYPKEKLTVMVVDDGSTDDTLKSLEFFKANSQVKIHHKENGGKYTALNFGIENCNSELIGCLDADSFVHKDALKNMIPYFEEKNIMAVVPAIKLHKADNILQKMQNVEYNWSILVRKILTYVNALHITPGPFTIFRKSVFDKIGKYKHAYLTEDLEMALRMQENHYKIANSHRSFVFTVAPKTFKTLYKQRLRWAYGYIKNMADYKHLLFKRKYGDLSMFILPFGVMSIFSALFFATNIVISNLESIFKQISKIEMVGVSFYKPEFDFFYLNTSLISIVGIFVLAISLVLILISMKLSDGKLKIKPELLYFMFIYPIITPFWLVGAVFNTIFSKTTTWR